MGNDLLPGTLDMLILGSLTRGARHGYGIAQHLKKISADVLDVGESSLYPALQRLLLNGWVTAEWGASENNRRARYYTLNAAGRNTTLSRENATAVCSCPWLESLCQDALYAFRTMRREPAFTVTALLALGSAI